MFLNLGRCLLNLRRNIVKIIRKSFLKREFWLHQNYFLIGYPKRRINLKGFFKILSSLLNLSLSFVD